MGIDNKKMSEISSQNENIEQTSKDIERYERKKTERDGIIHNNGDSFQPGLSINHDKGDVFPIWLPADKSRCEVRHDVSLRVIKLVEKAGEQPNDFLERLKLSWPGRIYLNHLKKYAFLRGLVIITWRVAYPLYVNYLSARFSKERAEKKWRQLVSLKEFTARNKVPIVKIADESSVQTPFPSIIPEKDKIYLTSPHESYTFQEVYISRVSGGTVYGGSNLVLAGDEVICHDLYDFKRDFTSEEMHGRTHIDHKRNRIRLLSHDKEPEKIAIAATFVDACAPNYAHWLTEVLPRIAIFCHDRRFEGIPIIVNDNLHDNIMTSLALVAGIGREIIVLPVGRALIADTLYVTSVVGYVPFDRRNKKLSNHSHGIFNHLSLSTLNKIIDHAIADVSIENLPKKVYLRRNSAYRKMINEYEVEQYFQDIGFSIVEPEKLNFIQQVVLFKNASVIVGPTGAGLANIIFAPQDAKIYILISKYKDTIYWYWQNIACATGKEVTYIMGDQDGKGVHSDFFIDTSRFQSYFENLRD